MGVWGAGLYSGDFALDLRASISAVARLPFDEDRLIDILCETEPQAANNPVDPDHEIFWLVLADQFARHGIESPRLRERALAIIDADTDTTSREALGASSSDLKKRRKILDEVRIRIGAPAPNGKKRTVLKEPQRLLMQTGDVFAYPTFAGHPINPYFASKEQDNKYSASLYGSSVWRQDGWAACIIIDCGRIFDFLAWYRPLTVSIASESKPDLAGLQGEISWKLENPGTCSKAHFHRLELEKLGTVHLDREKINRVFPGMKPGKSAAVQDISIANNLRVSPATLPSSGAGPSPLLRKFRSQTIQGLHQILLS